MYNRRRFLQSLLAGGSLLTAPFRYWQHSEEKLTALVVEQAGIQGLWSAVSGDNVSRVGNQLGAAKMLEEVGFEVHQLNPNIPFVEQKPDLFFLGSYISTNESIVHFLEQNGDVIREFVENGGIVIQFVESPLFNQFYNSTLPKKGAMEFILPSHLHAKRTRETFWDIYVRAPDHPLLKNMQVEESESGVLGLSEQFGHNATWMAIGERKGFNVLLSNTEDDSRAALIEGVHGAGRYIFSSLFFDRLFDEGGNVTRSEEFMETVRNFYKNLLNYTRNLNGPKGVPVVTGAKYEDPAPAAFPEGAFTLVMIPDTQYYCQTPGHNYHFHNIVDWIVNHRDKYNIRYVLHLGDVVNRGGIEMHQWDVAAKAMHKLDDKVPYSISLGNHDYADDRSRNRETPLNEYFPPSRYANWPSFGGCMEKGHLENTYHTFEALNSKYLILALEFGPRDKVLEWANKIVKKHQDHRVILSTHAYMYSDDHRFNLSERNAWQAWNPHNYRSEEGNNDGKDMWDKLVSRHSNFFLVAGGHVINDGLGRKSMVTPQGNTVHQMLFNYQGYFEGGMGTIRLLHFFPDNKCIQVRTYSTSLGRFFTGIQEQFQLELDINI